MRALVLLIALTSAPALGQHSPITISLTAGGATNATLASGSALYNPQVGFVNESYQQSAGPLVSLAARYRLSRYLGAGVLLGYSRSTITHRYSAFRHLFPDEASADFEAAQYDGFATVRIERPGKVTPFGEARIGVGLLSQDSHSLYVGAQQHHSDTSIHPAAHFLLGVRMALTPRVSLESGVGSRWDFHGTSTFACDRTACTNDLNSQRWSFQAGVQFNL